MDLADRAPLGEADFYPARAARGSFRDGLARHAARARPDLVGIRLPGLASQAGPLAALVASLLLPGLGQRRNGQARRAWAFGLGWAALVFLNVVTWTTSASQTCVGALLAWTAASMADAFLGAVSLATGRPPLARPRLVVGATLLAAGAVTLLPLGYWLGTSLLFDRVRAYFDLPGLRADEVALLDPGALDLERGDMALTRWSRDRVVLGGAHVARLGLAGTYPEVIVGLPGEALEVRGGMLLANGEVVMDLSGLPEEQRDLWHDVPPGSHVSVRWTIGAGSDPVLVELPLDHVRGRLWAVSWPPERRRILRNLTDVQAAQPRGAP